MARPRPSPCSIPINSASPRPRSWRTITRAPCSRISTRSRRTGRAPRAVPSSARDTLRTDAATMAGTASTRARRRPRATPRREPSGHVPEGGRARLRPMASPPPGPPQRRQPSEPPATSLLCKDGDRSARLRQSSRRPARGPSGAWSGGDALRRSRPGVRCASFRWRPARHRDRSEAPTIRGTVTATVAMHAQATRPDRATPRRSRSRRQGTG